ncbi:hypothetical protein TEA_013533 [Camellia sinensis var. sinensis]|uniref:Uncharacterized protein n=1 Tax=Camellia sinensis var. sinensis TaxID=542762 RepID=A0A4S4EKT5_CAMSN|nr:hypothetical protein TEA_013533 [Camellia sinensis var. sinensis]
MRSICVLQLLNTKRVHSFRRVREEETIALLEKIENRSSSPMDLSEMLASLTNDVICRVTFGRKYSEGERGKKFKELLEEFGALLGVFNKDSSSSMDGGASLDRDNLKAIILDMFAAGADTTYTVLEWAMTELLRHPTIMKKLQEEVRGIAPKKTNLSEDDLEQMHYLKAIIKETLQLHPPVPLLISRESTKHVKLQGYDIPTETRVFINAWTIGRDPLSWKEPEEFRPERFLNSFIDFNGQIFQFIPFGAGRRGCPGIVFAIANLELVGIAPKKANLSEDDLEQMHYLKAIIKETLQLHPPVPLLISRESTKHVKLQGYDIPTETRVFINAWTIGRDPLSWKEPEEFRPERFLNSFIDYNGQNFQFIPFGAGRRGCPGIVFATANLELVLASLVHKFDWALPGGVTGDNMDLAESSGITIHRKFPLILVATPCF